MPILQLHLQQKLREELAATSFRSGWSSAALLLLYQLPFYEVLRNDKLNWLLSGILILSYAARVGLHDLKKIDDKTWLNLHSAVIGVHSVCWSVLLLNAVFRYHNEVQELTVLSCVMFAGLCAGASYGLSMSKRDFFLFVTPILSTQVVVFSMCYDDPRMRFSGSFIIILFFAFLSKQRNRSGRAWNEQRAINFELQNTIDAVPGGISIIRGGRYAIVNQYVRDMAGFESDLNDPGASLVKSAEKSTLSKKMLEFIRSEQPRIQTELDLSVNGNKRTHLVTASRAFTGDVIVSTTDIHDLKQIEHEVDLQKIKMQHSAKMASLGEMSGGLAHEINNPLAIISGRAQQLRMRVEQNNAPSEFLLKGLGEINSTCERIKLIIQGLRNFSDGNYDQEESSTVGLRQMVEGTLNFCEAKFRHDGVKIINEIPPEIRMDCRSRQISQVILNVLSNSYDAILGRDEKWIHLKARTDKDHVYICITDSGPGIAESLREKVMQPFFSTKEIGKGTGLGLSVSKGIVESHKGEIYFNNKSPNTQLVIVLPLHRYKFAAG